MDRRRLLSKIGVFLDYFVPAQARRMSQEHQRRARIAVGISWLMVPVFLVLTAIHAISYSPRQVAINFALTAIMALGPISMRLTGLYLPILHSILSLAFLCIVALSVFSRGGGLTPATIALAELPLFAVLLGGIRFGALWAILCCLAGIVIGYLHAAKLIVDRLPASGRVFDEHASLVVITATLFLVAAVYEYRTSQGLRRLAKTEVKRRKAERDKFEAVAEMRLARAERMASMGRIAAATAHEINNPLLIISANLQYLSEQVERFEQPGEVGESLEEALFGVKRITRIVDDMGRFAKTDDEHIGSVDLIAAIQVALQMAEPVTRAKTRVRTVFDQVPAVVGDSGRLTQVFLNLFVNAAEAMADGTASENEILVSARQVGDRVRVEIQDSGPGLPLEVQEHVFEPFITSKPVGEGLGLGLALSHSIVKRYGGTLEISRRGDRTIARMFLRKSSSPAVVEDTEDKGLSSEEAPPVATEQASGGAVRPRLLIVDDEQHVGRSLKRILPDYEITLVDSGREALRVLLGEQEFDLILCDIMMPDVSGMMVYETLSTSHPTLARRIVFMSGGTFTERSQEFRQSVENPFIDKPVDRSLLLSTLERRLGQLGEVKENGGE